MRKVYLSVVLLTFCFSSFAQVTNAVEKEKIMKQIKIIEEIEAKGMLESDTVALKKIWADDFHVYNPYNLIFDKSKVLQGIKSTFIKFSTFTREQEYYGIYDDVVYVMGKETVVFSGENPNKGKTLVIRYTNIYKLFDGNWKTIARHANIII